MTLAGKQPSRVLTTISGDIPDGLEASIAAGDRPLTDYIAIAEESGSDLLDRQMVRSRSTLLERIVNRVAGPNCAMALQLYRTRDDYDVIFTDGEQVGLPLAALFRLTNRRRPRHAMIGHRVSARKKRAVIRVLGLTKGIDEVFVYASNQLYAGQDLFHRPGQTVSLIDFMVDTNFFEKQDRDQSTTAARPLIVTAGREFRDYPTLIDAVTGLDVDVVIASASPWSRRRDNAHDVEIPSNVTVTSLTQRELRDLFDRADLAVVPLQPVDFQAGVTTILEAMAMELPVVCTATLGQIDVVAEGKTGRYVGPGDVLAMRRAIVELLDSPDDRAELGKAGRQLVEARADVRFYARRLAGRLAVHAATQARAPRSSETSVS